MIYRSKLLFLLSHCMKNIFASKSRFFLSFLGIFLSAFLFTAGTIVIDTYYHHELSKYYSYSDRTIVINNIQNSSLNNLSEKDYNIYNYSKQTNYSFRQIENQEHQLNIIVNVFDTNYRFNNYLIPTFENNSLLYKDKIIQGRGFTKEDLINPSVCIIDEFTSEVLFGKTNSIGEMIKIPIFENISVGENVLSREITSYDYKTVVGIIENSDYTKQNRLKFISQLADIKENSTFELNVFVPGISNDNVNISVLYSHKPIVLEDFSRMLQNDRMRGGFTTLESITFDISRNQQEMNTYLQLAFFVLLTILGFNLLNVIFFSVKERVKEIGIKKALGASNEDILLSFLVEGLLLGVISVAVGIIFSIFICFIIGFVLKETAFPALSLTIDGIKLLLVFMVSLSLSILFSLFPAWYASKIKIIDAIKFE